MKPANKIGLSESSAVIGSSVADASGCPLSCECSSRDMRKVLMSRGTESAPSKPGRGSTARATLLRTTSLYWFERNSSESFDLDASINLLFGKF